ncbi:MAG: MBL fold metallo-hydrolase [Arcobacter sp.]|nr:MAG: MBL fold metallo-hydrolase [Arcobacter sp.]
MDPGCSAAFDDVLESVECHRDSAKLKYIYFLHQDPDVSVSLAEWVSFSSAKGTFPRIWSRFMEHYGVMDESHVIRVLDKGMKFNFFSSTLEFIPAYFLHSPEQFSIYDEEMKILFSADIGAAVLPIQEANKPLWNFEDYSKYLQGFHQRFMAGNSFCKAWVTRVKERDIKMIAPQHGAVFENEMVSLFLKWFNKFKYGSDFLEGKM